jgi:cardiolipin synthase
VFTIPNLISILRLFLIPSLVISILRNNIRLALILLLISYISDIVDGFLARNLHQESEFGKMIDPLSDKITLLSVLIALTIARRFPFWATTVLTIREVLIISGGFFLLLTGRKVIPASLPGKITGWIIGGMTIVYILDLGPLLKPALYLALASMTISFYIYSQEFLNEVKKQTCSRGPDRP